MRKQDKFSVVRAFSKEYRGGRKRDKTLLLTRLVKTTGYSRKHLMEILPNPSAKRGIKRKRKSPYLLILKPLRKLWAVGNYACGIRLAPMIPIYLSALKKHEGWLVSRKEKRLLLRVSASTVDRLLKHERRRLNLKGRSRTKPGSLLKNQIPIRTFADWTEKKPGFLEIDTVHHCTEENRGDYLHTLDTTDVHRLE